MNTNRIKIRLVPALCFLIGSLLLVAAAFLTVQHERSARFDTALDDARHNGQRIEMHLGNAVNITEMIGSEMRVLEKNGLVEQEAESILSSYYHVYSGSVSNVQYAPGGYVKYIYPEEGNEAGHMNLFETEGRSEDATFSRDTGHTLINGPFNLVQGGRGIVINNPVYYEKNSVDPKDFMGFSTVIVDADEIIDNPSVLSLKQDGYRYLVLKNELHSERADVAPLVVSSNDMDMDSDLSDTASYEFELEGYRFSIYAIPVNGWIDLPHDLAMLATLELIVVLVSILLNSLLSIREKSELLKELSMTDHLTGLLNRTALRDRFPTMVGRDITVCMLDIDYFKTYNDTYGHEMGDKVLRSIAEVMRSYASDTFTIFRFGGDEFLIWDTSGDEEGAIKRIDAMMAEVDQVKIRGCEFPIHMSYGACHGKPTTDEELRNLRYVADQRLYEVKAARPARSR